MTTGDGTMHQKTDERLGHHQSMSQMLYGTSLGPGRSGSSSSSPVGGANTGSGLLVVPQPLGKGPTKLQPLHAHARKYHCKMCPQEIQDGVDGEMIMSRLSLIKIQFVNRRLNNKNSEATVKMTELIKTVAGMLSQKCQIPERRKAERLTKSRIG
ncbi:unnamed protein product [Leptosia nina]|uniref:Uncharacterized protein n=1 Tax=Leptosia nina TaxID=320188 RepID=A0AAV1JB17_9NEOP